MNKQRTIRQMIVGVWVAFGFMGLLAAQSSESLAVLDFEGRGISASEVAILSERLRSSIVKTGKMTVVERGMMESVLQEQDFQITGCTTSDCAVQVGQLLGVTAMVAGSIGKIGQTYSIDLRLVDVETGQITTSIIRDYQGQIDGLLAQMGDIALELVGMEGEAPPPSPIVAAVSPVTGIQGFRAIQIYPQGKVVLKDGSIFKGKNLQIGTAQFKIRVSGTEQTYNLTDANQLFGKKGLAKKFGGYCAGCCAGLSLWSWSLTGGETTTVDQFGNEMTTTVDSGQFLMGVAIWVGIFYGGGYAIGAIVDDWTMVHFDRS